MILASRHDAALTPVVESLTNRLERGLDVITGSRLASVEVAADLQGLLLIALTMPSEAGAPWVEVQC